MGNPVEAARRTFYGPKKYVYGHNTGGQSNPNADSGNSADCTYLAYVANNQAGYNVPYFSTGALTKGSQLTADAARYYEAVDPVNAKPGDMLVFNGHVMLIQSGNGIAGTALGAQSPETGLVLDEKFGRPGSYWGNANNGTDIKLVVRPRPETYVPEKDLVGGPGTGIDSPKVASLVNLLKDPTVEGFRPGIYADSQGVPTVGDGLALVVKSKDGWIPLPAGTLKGLLITAGLDPDMADALPWTDLERSAKLLNAGNKIEASAIFGDGKNPADGAFRISVSQADQLTAAYVIREVVPKVITGLSNSLDPGAFNELTDGQFAAIGSRVYQSPGWLRSEQGKKFVAALNAGDDATAAELLSQGRGARGELEAQAFHRPPVEASSPATQPDSPLGGHWEDQANTDPMGGLYGGTTRVWVPDATTGTALSSEFRDRPLDIGRGSGWDAPAPPPHQGNPAQYSDKVQVKTGPDGTVYRSYEATQDAPPNTDGRLAPFKRGDIISMETDPQGRVIYESVRHVENGITSLRETERDPLTGKVTVTWTDSVLIDGASFTRDHGQQGPWRDASGRTVEERLELALNQEVERLLARYPAPDPGSPAMAGAQAGSAGDTASADIEQEIARLKNRSNVVGVTESPVAAPAPASPVDASSDDVQAVLNWRPDPSPAGPALAAADGGIQTDGGLQKPSSGLPAQPTPVPSDPPDASSVNAVNGSDLESDQARSAPGPSSDSADQLPGDLGLASSLLHWDQQGDLGHVQTALSLYNRLNGEGWGPNLGGVAAGLGLISSAISLADALQSGDAKAIIGSSASFGSSAIQVYSLVEKAPLSVGGTSTALGQAAGALGVVGGAIALSDALEHGNALQIAGAAASTAASAMMVAGAACPPLAIVGAFLSIAGGLWQDDPEPKGDTVLSVNALGQLDPALVQDQDGGGDTALQAAHGVVEALMQMLQASNQAFAADGHDERTYGWGLNPFALEGLHIGYDSTLGNGFTLTTPEMSMAALTWQGLMEQVSDYAQRHDAIIPAWQSDTLQGHWQLAQGDPALQAVVREGADHLAPLTAEERGDHLERALQTLSTEVPPGLLARLQAAAPNANDGQTLLHMALGSAGYANERVFDVDGDGLQERSAWVGDSSALLAVDLHGDGLVHDGTQLLTGAGQGLNSGGWLDANGDGRLDDGDPAYGALLMWLDVNGDGINEQGESLTLRDAGLVAVDLGSGQLVWADGHRSTLNRQTLVSENDGHRLTSIEDPQGQPLGAGVVVENQGYQLNPETGEVVRRHDYGMHLAAATGDWQGTEQAAEHRHGGGVATDLPVQTEAGAAIGDGALLRDVTTTQAAVDADDARLRSLGAPRAATGRTEVTFDAADSRLANGDPGVALSPNAGGRMPVAAAGLITSAATVSRSETAVLEARFEAGDAAIATGALGRVVAQGDGELQAAVMAAGRVRSAAPGTPAETVRTEVSIEAGDTRLTSGAAGAAMAGQPAGLRTAIEAAGLITGAMALERRAEVVAVSEFADGDGRLNAGATGSVLAGQVAGRQESLLAAGLLSGEPARTSGERTVETVRFDDADPQLAAGRAGTVLTGQAAGEQGRVQVSRAQMVSAPMVFTPLGSTGATQALREATADMVRSAEDPMFASPLIALALGAGALQWPALASAEEASEPLAAASSSASAEGTRYIRVPISQGDLSPAPAPHQSVFDDAHLEPATGWSPGPAVVDVHPRGVGLASFGVTQWRDLPGEPFAPAPAMDNHGAGLTLVQSVSPAVAPAPSAATVVIDYPELEADEVPGVEDAAARISEEALLANDSTINRSVDPLVPELRIVSVGQAVHGQVVLQTETDAQGHTSSNVLFTPDANFHGTASFDYTVSDAYGLTRTATAVVEVAAVNDSPLTADEIAAGEEDTALYFLPADLLANDSDVDASTDPGIGQGQTLTITALQDAQHGQAAWATDAQGRSVLRFVPDPDYAGPAQFSYVVSDGAGGKVPATVHLTVNPVNDAPRLAAEMATSLEDEFVAIDPAALLANDMDVDDAHDTLALIEVSNPQHGQVSLTVDAQGRPHIGFTPEANYHGPAGFDYTVQDPHGARATTTASIEIGAVNDVPVAAGERTSTEEDRGLIFTVPQLLANDTDADIATDGDSLHIARVDAAQHGTARLDEQGRIAFLPDADYHGTASFRYWVADQHGAESVAMVEISVTPVNDRPIAQGERLASTEDALLYIAPGDLLANDSDVDMSTDPAIGQQQLLTISSVFNARHGAVERVASGPHQGMVRFAADPDYHGVASFDYEVSDGAGGIATATAVIDLAPVNDAPVTQGERASGDEDREFVFASSSLLANDSDVDALIDGDSLRVSRVGNAAHGAVSLDALGHVHFVPDTDYSGPAQFTYWVADRDEATLAGGSGFEVPATVELMIYAVNDAPVVLGETLRSTEDVNLAIAAELLLANDRDVDNLHGDLRISGVGQAQHGRVSLEGDGTVLFVPDSDYSSDVAEPASFEYTVTDGEGGFATGRAFVELEAVNDAPVATGEVIEGREDRALALSTADLLANDSDVDNAHAALSVISVRGARHGQVEFGPDGQVLFTPDADYNDTLGSTAGFDYVVSDGAGGSATATVTVHLSPVNDAPRVLGEVAALPEDTLARFSPAALLANDADVDNAHAQLSIAEVGHARHGVVAMIDGEVVFTPSPDFSGEAGFDYVVSDGAGGTSSATVNLTYTPVNDAPIVAGEVVSAREDQVLTIAAADLLANDSDMDNPHGALTIASVSNAVHGLVQQDTAGNIIFTPDADYNDSLGGPASFDYVVSDGAGGRSTASVTVRLSAFNDAPNVLGEAATLAEDTVARFTPAALLANDADVDNPHAELSIASIGQARNGSVAWVAGEVVFTPAEDFSGLAGFDYVVSDSAGGLTSGSVNLTYTPVNDAPMAVGEVVHGTENQPLIFTPADLLANDADVDSPHAALRISAVGDARHGSVAFDAQGRIVFTPELNYSDALGGPANFSYTVADGDGGTATASVVVSLNGVNQAPTVFGETLSLAEDAVVRLTTAALLANDSDVDNSQSELVVSSVGNARHGTVALVGSEVVFTPAADYDGAAGFDYVVSDGAGGLSTATVGLTYTPVNDAPFVAGEIVQGSVNQPLIFTVADLLANDIDVDNPHAALTITEVGGAEHGSVVFDAGGRVVFIPDLNYSDSQGGPASFTYTVSDGAGGVSTGRAVVHLGGTNQAPVVFGESLTLDEDTIARFSPAALLANDTDADSPHADLTVSSVGNAQGGTVALANGEVVFTPLRDFNGIARFDYVVSDGDGGSSQATVELTYTPVNDAPLVTGEVVQGQANQTLLFTQADLLANDTDVDTPHGALVISAVGGAQHGSVAFDGSGQIIFTPEAGYSDAQGGPASFTYIVSDGAGGAATATTIVHLGGSNQAPTVTGETVTLDEDTVARFLASALLANDTDVDNPHGDLSIASVGNAQGGGVALVNGEVIFTPTQDFNGAAGFDYVVSDGVGGSSRATVQLTYLPVNDLPLAVGEIYQGQEDEAVNFSAAALLANDSDVETPHGALVISGVSNARHGTVVMDATGGVLLTPDADYNEGFGAPAGFDYAVSDGTGGVATASVFVQLAPVNDAPAAQGETVAGAVQDAALHVPAATLLANDSDIDDATAQLRLGWVGNAVNGSVVMEANGDVTFTPAPGFVGAGSFDYRVADAAGALSPAVTASIPVGAVNHNPVAVDNQFASTSGALMVIGAAQLLANDSDPDGQVLTVAAVRNAQHGDVAIDAQGNVTFALEAGFAGQAKFEYQANDGLGGTTWATAYIDVLQPNVVPVLDSAWALAGAEEVTAGISVPEFLELRMTSPINSALTYTLLSGPYWGGGASNIFTTSYTPTTSVPFSSRDYPSLTVRVGDEYGNWTDVEIQGGSIPWHTSQLNASVVSTHVAPVVLDLDGDGVGFYQVGESTVTFDLNHDGRMERVAWANRHDGVLVFDANADRTVTGAEEFSFTLYQPGARTDLEGLRAFDSNHDGRLDSGDARWSAFGVWQDMNGDGRSEASEFRTLDELGMAALALQSNGQYRRVGSDVSVMGEAVVTHTDGSTSIAADASFMATAAPGAVAEPARDAPAEPSLPEAGPLRAWEHDAMPSGAWEAEIARRAHRFIDLANWSPESDMTPVTFVPSAGFHFAHQLMATPEFHEPDAEMPPPWALPQRDAGDARTFAQRP